jgi:hypothetical protein
MRGVVREQELQPEMPDQLSGLKDLPLPMFLKMQVT